MGCAAGQGGSRLNKEGGSSALLQLGGGLRHGERAQGVGGCVGGKMDY